MILVLLLVIKSRVTFSEQYKKPIKRLKYESSVGVRILKRFVRSEVESDNMYANLDACLAKIEKQIVKHSDKLIDKKRNQLDLSDLMFFDELPVFKAPKITKRKDYELIPMSDNEAIEAMDLLGNSFYIYQDIKTGDVKVAYIRNDGDYGIITTHH